MTQRTRIGVAGLGRMGRHHAGNISGHCPSAELVRVFDVDEALAKQTAADLGTDWTTSYDHLLSDDVDAVVIAVPTSLHVDFVIRAARAGKHILCEKPLSLDRRSAREALEEVRRAGVKLQVGFHRRFDPDWAAAASSIAAGELGDIYLFRTSLRDMAPPSVEYLRGSGGFFVDMTIHDFDTARWMIGEIKEVGAFGAALSGAPFEDAGDIDNGVITIRFTSGALGVIDNIRVAGYGYECSTEVMGSKGTVRIDRPNQLHLTWLSPGRSSRDYVKDFLQRYPAAYRQEMESFADAVANNKAVAVGGADALAAFDLCKAAELSHKEKRVVKLEHRDGPGGIEYRAVT
ncbi:MAG TPA: Gfo/Idh/MocA family oxidoreductase [Actinomycetota bacterium]|nr:Gfo/Idh/MocA family oxidoreductase [Actinomycetota bacterium]